MKILMYSAKDYDIASFDSVRDRYGITFSYVDTMLTMQTVSLAEGYDGICIFVNDKVDREMADALYARGIRLILLRCAGFNGVDLLACCGRIRVLRVPAYSPYAVAEFTAALLMTSVRRVHKAYNRTRDNNFSISGLTGFDLHGKTVGIIGTGKIGRIFANICAGFGMHVLGYDMYPSTEFCGEYVSLDALFSGCDIISLHCPLTEQTRYLINGQAFEKMKKGVIILNTSRGALIDSSALLEALKERKVGAVCLDVYEEESDIFFRDVSGHILNDDVLARLLSMPNVIVTSHQAFLTSEALENIATTTCENALHFLHDEETPNEVCGNCPRRENCPNRKRNRA